MSGRLPRGYVEQRNRNNRVAGANNRSGCNIVATLTKRAGLNLQKAVVRKRNIQRVLLSIFSGRFPGGGLHKTLQTLSPRHVSTSTINSYVPRVRSPFHAA